MSKVQLLRPVKRRGWQNPDASYITLKESLPFFRKAQGTYIHRVRAGQIHMWKGVYSHTVFTLWCGNSGYADQGGTSCTGRAQRRYNSSELYATPPENSVLCATCEGRAIGAGIVGARTIAGRPVLFAPRV